MGDRITKFECMVGVPGGYQRFVIIAHPSPSRDERLIDAAFYTDNWAPDAIPEGQHYELEIMAPKVWRHRFKSVIHYRHVPDTGRIFVCWTGQLPTIDPVRSVLCVWCVGTAYSMSTGLDFGPEYAREPATFLERMTAQGFVIRRMAMTDPDHI